MYFIDHQHEKTNEENLINNILIVTFILFAL